VVEMAKITNLAVEEEASPEEGVVQMIMGVAEAVPLLMVRIQKVWIT